MQNSSVPIVVNMETMLKKIVEYDYEKGILTSMVREGYLISMVQLL